MCMHVCLFTCERERERHQYSWLWCLWASEEEVVRGSVRTQSCLCSSEPQTCTSSLLLRHCCLPCLFQSVSLWFFYRLHEISFFFFLLKGTQSEETQTLNALVSQSSLFLFFKNMSFALCLPILLQMRLGFGTIQANTCFRGLCTRMWEPSGLVVLMWCAVCVLTYCRALWFCKFVRFSGWLFNEIITNPSRAADPKPNPAADWHLPSWRMSKCFQVHFLAPKQRKALFSWLQWLCPLSPWFLL